jgi:group I intron endonuclease
MPNNKFRDIYNKRTIMIIYKSTNKITEKIYIGQTKHALDTRIKNHIKESKQESNRPFMSSINKHGIDNFTFEIIDSANNLDELNDKEIYWINFYNSVFPNGYNVTGGGQGKKIKTTKELSRIISEGLKNSKKWQKTKNSEEYKKKRKKYFIGWNKGKKFTLEHKEKIWEKNKERILKFNKNTSKKWIVVDKDNNITRITGKEEFFENLGMDAGDISRMSKILSQGKNRKRYNGYYCFIDNGESNETILDIVLKLDDFYNKEYKIYNRITQEIKILKKDEVYSFCISKNYDYSSFLRMIKGQFKSYKNWVI